MTPRLTIVATGLPDLEHYLQIAPKIVTKAARMALNDIARADGMKLMRTSIQLQVDFPAGYLELPDRLYVSRYATDSLLESGIGGRARATSLARFAKQSYPGKRGAGIDVEVKPGELQHLPKAFLVRLRRGASLTEDNYNVGLAVRLKPGEHLRNVRDSRTVTLADNLYLLYGPSVDQVFRDVAAEESPQIVEMVGSEFLRQFNRLSESEL